MLQHIKANVLADIIQLLVLKLKDHFGRDLGLGDTVKQTNLEYMSAVSFSIYWYTAALEDKIFKVHVPSLTFLSCDGSAPGPS